MKKLLVLLLYTFLISNFRVFPNDENVQYEMQSGTAIPVQSSSIIMKKEVVILKDKTFTTTFTFYNDSNKIQKVTMGFPVLGNIEYAGTSSMFYEPKDPLTEKEKQKAIIDYYKFTTKIDGKEIQRKLIPYKGKLTAQIENDFNPYARIIFDYTFTVDVVFQPKQTRIVENTYFSNPAMYDTPTEYHYQQFYLIESGEKWKDDIETGIFKFYIPYDEFITDWGENYFSAPYLKVSHPVKNIYRDGEYFVLE